MPGPSSPSLRILISGDDPLVRQGLVRTLEQCEDSWQFHDTPPQRILDVLEQWPPDILLWNIQESEDIESKEFDALKIPLLVLVENAQLAREWMALGAKGALYRDGNGMRMSSAIRAIEQGLVVFDEAFASEAFRPSASPPEALIEPLTPREQQVLPLLAEGLSNKEIARELNISEHTAKFHVNAILGKLDAQSRTEAVVRAARLGLLHL